MEETVADAQRSWTYGRGSLLRRLYAGTGGAAGKAGNLARPDTMRRQRLPLLRHTPANRNRERSARLWRRWSGWKPLIPRLPKSLNTPRQAPVPHRAAPKISGDAPMSGTRAANRRRLPAGRVPARNHPYRLLGVALCRRHRHTRTTAPATPARPTSWNTSASG